MNEEQPKETPEVLKFLDSQEPQVEKPKQSFNFLKFLLGFKDKKQIFIYSLLGVLLIMSVYSFAGMNKVADKLQGSEWVCFLRNETICESGWLTGDQWIDKNCKPVEGVFMCNLRVNQFSKIDVPLTAINISQVKDCEVYKCEIDVFVRLH